MTMCVDILSRRAKNTCRIIDGETTLKRQLSKKEYLSETMRVNQCFCHPCKNHMSQKSLMIAADILPLILFRHARIKVLINYIFRFSAPHKNLIFSFIYILSTGNS